MRCGICDETSHPTADCPLRGKNIAPQQKAKIDAEYEAFLAEIGEGDPMATSSASSGAKDVEKSYEQFMAEIEGMHAHCYTELKRNPFNLEYFAGGGGAPQQAQAQQQFPVAPAAVPGYPPHAAYGMYPPPVWNPWMAVRN